MAKFLVTFAAGFIGRSIVAALIARGGSGRDPREASNVKPVHNDQNSSSSSVTT